MTIRAFLWCGYAREGVARPDISNLSRGEKRSRVAKLIRDDFTASVNELQVAYDAALRLGVEPGHVFAFLTNDDLRPNDFKGSMHQPTIESLLAVVSGIAQTSLPEDALLFFSSNHGGPTGLFVQQQIDELGEDMEPQVLSPEIFRAAFDRVQGSQLLVLSACNSGLFLCVANERRAVLASCNPDEEYQYVHDDEGRPYSVFGDVLLARWTGVTSFDQSVGGPMSLHDAFRVAEAEMRRKGIARSSPLYLVHESWSWPGRA
jgi:hypothetical protein